MLLLHVRVLAMTLANDMAFLRHEELSVKLALAKAGHHSAHRVEGGGRARVALRPADTDGAASGALRLGQGDFASLALPVLAAAADEAIDSATLLLVLHAFEEKNEEQEELRRKSKSKKGDEAMAWLVWRRKAAEECLFLDPLREGEEEEEAQVEAASGPSSSSCPPFTWRARPLRLLSARGALQPS